MKESLLLGQVQNSLYFDSWLQFKAEFQMINNLIPCSKESLYEDVLVRAPSSIREEQKLSEIYELPHYQATSHRRMSSETPQSSVCTLAAINKQNKLEINPEAFQIMAAYSKFDLICCGVYGAKSSGKSTFIDHFLEKESGASLGFKAAGKLSAEESLIMNKSPISTGANKKLFFIQYSKGFESAAIAEKSQKLLDLLIFMCNSLVVMGDKGEALRPVVKRIEASAKRLKLDSQAIHFWPENLYLIDNYNNLGRDLDGIDRYFRRTSLILWTSGDSKALSHFLSDVGSTSDAKSFRGISNNFLITRRLAERVVAAQNALREGSLPTWQIFEEVYEQMCLEYLLYHQQLYDSTLQLYFLDERPYRVDYLIQSFDKCRETILEHFRQNHIVKDFPGRELDKLEGFIEQRERLIVEVNRKKSQFELNKELASIATFRHKFPRAEDLETAMGGLRGLHERFEHAGVELYAATLRQMIRNLEKGHKKLAKKAEQHQESTLTALLQQIQSSRQQLRDLRSKNGSSLVKMKDCDSKMGQLREQANRLRKQLQLQRKTHKQIFNGKLTSQEKADKLLDIVRQLEETVRQNQKARREIQKQYDFNPQVERLQRKLERLERERSGEGSKLERTQSKVSMDNKTKGGQRRSK